MVSVSVTEFNRDDGQSRCGIPVAAAWMACLYAASGPNEAQVIGFLFLFCFFSCVSGDFPGYPVADSRQHHGT